MNVKLSIVKKVIAPLCLLSALGQVNAQTQDFMLINSNTDAIPAAAAATLKEMGSATNIPATAALYAPTLSAGNFDNLNVQRNLAYGTHERNVLDIFAAKDITPGQPVVVFVHGGGFGGGNKNNPNGPFYDNIPSWAANHGLVGVNINYRLIPESTWPSGIDDLRLVVSWLKENIAQYGGNPDKIFLWGKSSGAAHITDYIADVAEKDEDEQIAGAILTSGFFELEDEVSVWANYYGDDVSRYEEMNAMPGLLTTDTPMFASVAEFDGEIYHEQFGIFMDAMISANRPVDSMFLNGHSHMSETYAIGTEDDSLTAPVLEFIQRITNCELIAWKGCFSAYTNSKVQYSTVKIAPPMPVVIDASVIAALKSQGFNVTEESINNALTHYLEIMSTLNNSPLE